VRGVVCQKVSRRDDRRGTGGVGSAEEEAVKGRGMRGAREIGGGGGRGGREGMARWEDRVRE